MQIPFYCSYKELYQNYVKDLENWKQNYFDGSESDYLSELKTIYIPFKNSTLNDINISYIGESGYPEYAEISINDYREILDNKLTIHLLRIGKIEKDTDLSYDGELIEIVTNPEPGLNVLDYWEVCNYRSKESDLVIDDLRHSYLKYFFTFDILLKFDSVKFKNFIFSVGKIEQFMEDRLISINDNSLLIKKVDFENPIKKIIINGSTQLLGYIFNKLIEGGFIEPLKTGTGEINKMATSQSILDHFDFSDKEEQPSVGYLKKAIFDNQLSIDKATHIQIKHLSKFD